MKYKKEIEYELNEPQQLSLVDAKKLARGAHFIDIKFRHNGEDKIMQGDYLRKIIEQL